MHFSVQAILAKITSTIFSGAGFTVDSLYKFTVQINTAQVSCWPVSQHSQIAEVS